MEFSLRVGDMSFFVFFKFEIGIFDIVQGMTENKPFAFLYVLSIFFFFFFQNSQRTTSDTDFELHEAPKWLCCRVVERQEQVYIRNMTD